MSQPWLCISLLLCATAGFAQQGQVNERAHERWVSAAAFRPDGAAVATCSDDQTIKVWDPATGMPRWQSRSEAPLTALAWAIDGTRLFTGTWRGAVQEWDGARGELLRSWPAHAENLTGLALSPRGARLATTSGDDRCKIWDLSSRRLLLTIEQENEYDATCAAFSPDGRFLAVGDGEANIKLYRVTSGELVLTLAGHQEAISALIFLPDGKRLLSGGADDAIRLWNAETGAELSTFHGHADDVAALSLGKNGTRLLSGGADRQAILWEVESGKVLHRFKDFPSAITAAALAPDGGRYLIGGQRVLRFGETPP